MKGGRGEGGVEESRRGREEDRLTSVSLLTSVASLHMLLSLLKITMELLSERRASWL